MKKDNLNIEKENNPTAKKYLIISIVVFILIVALTILILAIWGNTSGGSSKGNGGSCSDGGTCPIHLRLIWNLLNL